MIVDSCIDPRPKEARSQRPPAIEYLRRIGVDPSRAVKLVIATHWHDDHIAGLASVLVECEAALFACSAALRPQEFLTLAVAVEARPMEKRVSSGLREFHRIFRILEERRGAPGKGPSQARFAASDRLIWRPPTDEAANAMPCEVHALAPSDASIQLALTNIAALIPTAGQPKVRILPQGPNHAAVVLWIKVGELHALLGADLEETGHPGTGWSEIVRSHSSATGKALVFKVAHHGSANGHHDDVWSQMLTSEPIAVLTPFVNGTVRLPREADVDRICSRTPRAYATAAPRPKRSSEVALLLSKTLPGGVRSIREVQGPTGQIRFRANARASADAEPEIRLLGSAGPLKAVYS